MTYFISVEDKTNGKTITQGFGDFKTLAYLGNYATKNLDESGADVEVFIAETDRATTENPTRVLMKFTADGDTVGTLIRSKLQKERAKIGADEAGDVPASPVAEDSASPVEDSVAPVETTDVRSADAAEPETPKGRRR